MKEKQYIHFSFDDIRQCLHDISQLDEENKPVYASVFDHPLFGWMKAMHEKYGVVFSLYTFNYFSTVPEYDISKLPDWYAGELKVSSGWLKFGFHAKDDLKKYTEDEPEQILADYAKFLQAILHATGNHEESIDRVVRLGFFEGSKANLHALNQCKLGLKGFLTADNDPERRSYYFGAEETAAVYEAGELWQEDFLFLRSMLRMELVQSFEEITAVMEGLTGPRVLELFSHEMSWYRNSRIEGYSLPDLCEAYFKWCVEHGYGWGYAQELYAL